MSGPKVVRIVTREEILEICRGQLARVDAALEQWTRIGRRNECVDDNAIAEAIRRRDALAALIAADRFMDLQKQAPAEEAFLRDDMQRRLAGVAAEQAAARSRERRGREAAEMLLRTLRASNRPIAPDLERRLERGDATALAAGFELLAGGSTATGSTELAARLREEEQPRTLADWMTRHVKAPDDEAVSRLDLRIAELGQLVDADRLDGWRARLDEATRVPSARRALLLDGLEVETGRALTEARQRGVALADLGLQLAEAETAGIDVSLWREATQQADAAALSAMSAAVTDAIVEHRSRAAAAARRAAVLEGLSSLGYEVAEGMATGLAEAGRLVLRSASRPDYGVEVAAAGERMQVRPVAFESGGVGPSVARDRDAETIWCGDVSKLRERLTAVGGDLVIEKALPVGATPLKRVAVAGIDAARSASTPTLRERSLK